MGRFGKLKSGSKQKLNRWKKGQSSSSNPKTKEYREVARSKYFHLQPTSRSNRGLTLEALKIHDEVYDSGQSHQMEENSEGSETVGTYLSGLSDCTNLTFRKIQRYWQNNSATHKEVCAVIAAITEVIRQQDEVESDTAYFAALVTALDSVESVESVAAVAYLLCLTSKKVPEKVLQARFSEVSKILIETIARYSGASGGPTTALVRSLLICLATILRHQDYESWSTESTMNIYQTLLSFVAHAKPKIRKAAQNGVCAVIKASTFMLSDTPPKHHPAASKTAEYCIHIIEKSGAVSTESSSMACHVVSLFGNILPCLPAKALKNSCETILKLMTLSQPVVKTVCFQALYSMFALRTNAVSMTVDLNAQILTALYDYVPSFADIQLLQAWLTVMKEGIGNLVHIWKECTKKLSNTELTALGHVTKFCKTCMKVLEANIWASAEAAASLLQALLQECLPHFKDDNGNASPQFDTTVEEVFTIIEEGLKYKFRSVWELIFCIFHSAYKNLAHPGNISAIRTGVASMADLRSTPLFPHKASLDKALGLLIVAIGPKLFLDVVPLRIDGTETDYDFPRSWLLPLLRDYIKNTELSFFISYFLPLIEKLGSRAAELRLADSESAAKPYDALQYQIWLLLPNFCDGATDMKMSLPTLARTIGSLISEHNDLCTIGMQAIRTLIMKSSDDADKQVIARFAKNYLPILFNFYTSVPATSPAIAESQSRGDEQQDLNKNKSPERLAALETIRLYLPLAEAKTVCVYFARAQTRVFDSEENSFIRLALLDLLVCMVQYVDRSNLNDVYESMTPMLNSVNHSMQKKAYRLLEEICASDSDECKEFVKIKLSEIRSLLADGLVMASPPSKGPRLRSIGKILKVLSDTGEYTTEECFNFVQDLIPEVILCTREKKKTRVAAFDVLIMACNVYCEVSAGDDARDDSAEEIRQGALTKFFEIIFTGLSGAPIMITASICALSRMIYEYKDVMSADLLNSCIKHVCHLLGTNTREVCKAALGFVAVLLSISDRQTLAQHVEEILGAFFTWKSETRRHFRFRVKKILDRFVRKFGFDMIYSLVPPEHRKQLSNLRKTKERQKRRLGDKKDEPKSELKPTKTETIEDILADSDSDSEDVPRTKKRLPKMQHAAWLKDAKEEPVDLLDQAASQNIIAANPAIRLVKPSKEAFKSAPDGRLIIDDGANSNDDNDVKLLSNLGIKKTSSVMPSIGQKRKLIKDDVSSDDDDKQYKPGGMGIHRAPGEEYKATKAKGDVKKKGMPDPYAYVPLNKSMLNRRKRSKLKGQFDGLVKATKHGAAKGKKMKRRERKN